MQSQQTDVVKRVRSYAFVGLKNCQRGQNDRPYGKCYLPITYCFRISFQKLPIPIPIGNCFEINKVTVTDTDPQKLPIPIPIGNDFGIDKVTVADTNPHPVPSPSSASLFGLIPGISQGFCA